MYCEGSEVGASRPSKSGDRFIGRSGDRRTELTDFRSPDVPIARSRDLPAWLAHELISHAQLRVEFDVAAQRCGSLLRKCLDTCKAQILEPYAIASVIGKTFGRDQRGSGPIEIEPPEPRLFCRQGNGRFLRVDKKHPADARIGADATRKEPGARHENRR